MNDTKQERPLRALGLANEAELGNLLWKLHQQWMYEDNPSDGDECLTTIRMAGPTTIILAG